MKNNMSYNIDNEGDCVATIDKSIIFNSSIFCRGKKNIDINIIHGLKKKNKSLKF